MLNKLWLVRVLLREAKRFELCLRRWFAFLFLAVLISRPVDVKIVTIKFNYTSRSRKVIIKDLLCWDIDGMVIRSCRRFSVRTTSANSISYSRDLESRRGVTRMIAGVSRHAISRKSAVRELVKGTRSTVLIQNPRVITNPLPWVNLSIRFVV